MMVSEPATGEDTAGRTASPVTYAFARTKGVAFRPGEAPAFLVREGGDRLALMEVRRVVGRSCPVQTCDAASYDRALSDIYAYDGLGADSSDADDQDSESLSRLIDEIPRTEDLLDSASDAPIIRLITGMIAEAVRTAASDIHVEPFEDRVSIRYSDGRLALTAPGRAMEDAHREQELSIVNLVSNNLVTGIARAEGVVEIIR